MQKNIVYTIYVSLVHDKKKHFILNRITLNSSIRFPRQLLKPFYTDCNHHNIYMFYTNLPYVIQIKNKFNLILMAIMQQHRTQQFCVLVLILSGKHSLVIILKHLSLYVNMIYIVKFGAKPSGS